MSNPEDELLAEYKQVRADMIVHQAAVEELAGRRADLMAKMRDNGMTYAAIARAVGLSHHRVSDLISERLKLTGGAM